MNYEIHITVECDDIQQFKEDCSILNVKPIIINATNQNQIMTSSKYSNDFWEKNLNELTIKLKELGYTIIRKKVEIQPGLEKHSNFIYYESHFRLKLSKTYNTDSLRKLCKERNFHFSRNILKNDLEFNYQMITFRSNSICLDQFIDTINDMKSTLKIMNVNHDKIEIEECIYDTNESIDKKWLY